MLFIVLEVLQFLQVAGSKFTTMYWLTGEMCDLTNLRKTGNIKQEIHNFCDKPEFFSEAAFKFEK